MKFSEQREVSFDAQSSEDELQLVDSPAHCSHSKIDAKDNEKLSADIRLKSLVNLSVNAQGKYEPQDRLPSL